GPLREEPLAPGPGLEEQVSAWRERAVRAEEAVLLEAVDAGARSHHPPAAFERLAAAADRVDLVDEDDALPAPLAREPLRLPRHVADDDHVHPDEGLGEARARHGQEGAVEARCDCFREHRLPGSGRAEEQETSLSLSARLLEGFAG